MRRPGIELTLKIRQDDLWDGPMAALFGTPQSWGEDFCERVKEKLQVEHAEVISAKLIKDT